MKVRAEAIQDWPDGTEKGRIVEIEQDAFNVLEGVGAARRAEQGGATVGARAGESGPPKASHRKPTYGRRDLTATDGDQG